MMKKLPERGPTPGVGDNRYVMGWIRCLNPIPTSRAGNRGTEEIAMSAGDSSRKTPWTSSVSCGQPSTTCYIATLEERICCCGYSYRSHISQPSAFPSRQYSAETQFPLKVYTAATEDSGRMSGSERQRESVCEGPFQWSRANRNIFGLRPRPDGVDS